MARLTRFFSVFLAVICLASTAYGQSGSRLKSVTVGFHTTLDPSAYASAAVAYARGDSASVFRGTGIRNSAQQVDTTATIDLRQFIIPGPPYSTITATDTTAWLRFTVFPVGTAPTVAADSITVAVQVSDDGVTWTATTYAGPNASVGTTPSSCIVLETGTANTFQYVIRQVLGGVLNSIFFPGITAPHVQRIFGYKYMRLLITGDQTGQYDTDVTGFIPSDTGSATR